MSRSICKVVLASTLALSTLIGTGAASAEDPVNLLLNSGFESGLNYWQTDNAITRSSEPQPYSGAAYLHGGEFVSSSTTSQTVDLIDEGFDATDLDSGIYAVSYGGWRATAGSQQTDLGKIELEFRDAGNGLISSDDLGSDSPGYVWTKRQGGITLPVGSRFITYRFITTSVIDRGGEDPTEDLHSNGSLEDAFLHLQTVVPLQVTAIDASIQLSGSRSHVIDITFSEQIDPSTFTLNDVTITGPSGTVNPISLNYLTGNTYRLDVAPEIDQGAYSIVIETDIVSAISGQVLNQDGIFPPGEPEDVYSGPIDSVAWNTLTLSSDFSISATDTQLDGLDLVIDGATLTIDGVHQFSSLALLNNSILTHSTGQIGGLQLDVGTVEIDGTSKIDVVGKGLGRLAGLE
ncbi:MAG: hypothetical protein GY924_13345, partial [Planctomycetaceae bacterium]|nr:hypothetical protein [Planctomycetaceae bacterium]